MKNLFVIRLARLAIIAAALASVTSCVKTPNAGLSQPTQTIEEREAMLIAFKPWRALGTIAVESKEQGKFNASFSWDLDAQGYEIKLFGPLGVQAFHLISNAQGAQLIDRKGQISGESAEQLLTAVLGVPVPLDKMQTWAVGLPGSAKLIQRDKIGRLKSMLVTESTDLNTGMKWNVKFERYSKVSNLDLPKSVLVSGDGIEIKLKFNKWIRSEAVVNDRLVIPGAGT